MHPEPLPKLTRTTNLKPYVPLVLKTPQLFNACTFANQPTGCRRGPEKCQSNHTLAGVRCPDCAESDSCRLRNKCPLFHRPVCETYKMHKICSCEHDDQLAHPPGWQSQPQKVKLTSTTQPDTKQLVDGLIENLNPSSKRSRQGVATELDDMVEPSAKRQRSEEPLPCALAGSNAQGLQNHNPEHGHNAPAPPTDLAPDMNTKQPHASQFLYMMVTGLHSRLRTLPGPKIQVVPATKGRATWTYIGPPRRYPAPVTI